VQKYKKILKTAKRTVFFLGGIAFSVMQRLHILIILSGGNLMLNDTLGVTSKILRSSAVDDKEQCCRWQRAML